MCIRDRLEESHDADDAEEFENLVLFAHPRHYEVDIERQRSDDVDYVYLQHAAAPVDFLHISVIL